MKHEYELPAFWAQVLINGDITGISKEDGLKLQAWCDDNPNLWCVSVDENLHFSRTHDATKYGVLACDVATFTFYTLPTE